ncbi:unnamed protein product [Rhodiola kirilowii]
MPCDRISERPAERTPDRASQPCELPSDLHTLRSPAMRPAIRPPAPVRPIEHPSTPPSVRPSILGCVRAIPGRVRGFQARPRRLTVLEERHSFGAGPSQLKFDHTMVLTMCHATSQAKPMSLSSHDQAATGARIHEPDQRPSARPGLSEKPKAQAFGSSFPPLLWRFMEALG